MPKFTAHNESSATYDSKTAIATTKAAFGFGASVMF
jgi:hypothetical protein